MPLALCGLLALHRDSRVGSDTELFTGVRDRRGRNPGRDLDLGVENGISALADVGNLIPELIYRALERRAAASKEPIDSIWFVDLDRQEEKQRGAFAKDTEDNPTIG